MGCNGFCPALGGENGVPEVLPSVGGLDGLLCEIGLSDTPGVGDFVQIASDWGLRLVLRDVQSSSC